MAPRSKDDLNMLRWDGQRRGWYEIYYLKFNDSLSRTAFWLRYTMCSPLPHLQPPYCELWGMYFDAARPRNSFALKKRYPIERLSWEHDRFLLHIDKAVLTSNACHGRLSDARHSLSWDLEFDSTTPPLYYYPGKIFYKLPLPRTKPVCPHIDAHFTGQVTVDERPIDLRRARGQQTHAWGTKHSHRWAWAHCNMFAEDRSAVFEGADAQMKLGPFTSWHNKGFFLRARGQTHAFNSLRNWLFNKSAYGFGFWDFEATSRALKIRGEIRCPLERMLGVTYTDPDGDLAWCYNSKIATIRLKLYKPTGQLLDVITSDEGCAVEFVERVKNPEIPILV